MKMDELREQSIEELQSRFEEIEGEVFSLRNHFAIEKKLEKPHILALLRKEKARILTILSQRKRGEHGEKA